MSRRHAPPCSTSLETAPPPASCSLLSRHSVISDIPAGKAIGDHIADTMLAGGCVQYAPLSPPSFVKAGLSLAPLSPSLFLSYPAYRDTHLALGLERPYVLHFNWM